MSRKKPTPAQQQYLDLKNQHKEAILFFRMGDFYEVFYDDAEIAHQELDLTLTAKDKKSDNPIPMAGVPHHSLDRYVQRLVQSGYKVAIADQVGEVVPGKVVDREVVRLVTPGTSLDDEQELSYTLAVTLHEGGNPRERYHIAWGDFSLGHYYTQSFEDLHSCLEAVQRYGPVEVIIDVDFPERQEAETFFAEGYEGVVSVGEIPHDFSHRLQSLMETTSLKGFGSALDEGRKHAVALLLYYLESTQKTSLKNIHSIQHKTSRDKVHLDTITLKNLEVFASQYNQNKKHSLFHVIDQTKTSMGSRLLRERLTYPTRDTSRLNEQFDQVDYYQEHADIAQELRDVCKHVPDLPRLQTKLLYRKPSALLLQNLRDVLDLLLGEGALTCKQELKRMGMEEETLNELIGWYSELQDAIKEEVANEDMDFVKEGYDKEIDELRQVAYNSDDLLVSYQQQIAEETGIKKVKLKFIKNQGYFIEIPKTEVDAFEPLINHDDPKRDFVRRKTLKRSERYVSTYLLELQENILEAKEQLKEREHDILQQLIAHLKEIDMSYTRLSDLLGEIDLAIAMALFAQRHDRTRPALHEDYQVDIQKGRHPIVEQFLPRHDEFIPNDLHIDTRSFFHLITGPNMGGKSTFLRQNALIILLAHAGLFVPATQAKLPLVDGIFARVGSGDALAQQQSTFMTEMIEMANILNNASENSFVILDELGRGTSTYDGMALAKAIIVYMCQEVSCKTLFATHYHELIHLENRVAGVTNFSVGVYESDKDVVFLKKVTQGGVSKSYGIDVAKLAGIPNDVLTMAKSFLKEMEEHEDSAEKPAQSGFNFGAIQDKYKTTVEQLHDHFDQYDINEITPVESLVKLQEIKKLLDQND